MGSITFLARRRCGGWVEQIQVRRSGRGRRTLLELIERHGLRHRCDCRAGTCGSCAVRVAVVGSQGGFPGVRLGPLERETLYAGGKLTRQQYAAPLVASGVPMWRLACQYHPGEEDIIVAL
ncbi:2Fe-2S iron-sulfur cluster-binding protein [Candidatus Methylocalor cossyra]|uniref:Ferredoxin n=1 Tax=Candidatus Methylocalor cossyra TaxID=3108543 RepID=A0ABM9NJ07_9GAMM